MQSIIIDLHNYNKIQVIVVTMDIKGVLIGFVLRGQLYVFPEGEESPGWRVGFRLTTSQCTLGYMNVHPSRVHGICTLEYPESFNGYSLVSKHITVQDLYILLWSQLLL